MNINRVFTTGIAKHITTLDTRIVVSNSSAYHVYIDGGIHRINSYFDNKYEQISLRTYNSTYNPSTICRSALGISNHVDLHRNYGPGCGLSKWDDVDE